MAVNAELEKTDYEHNTGVDDDLSNDIVIEQVKNLNLELKMFKINIGKIIEGRDRFKRQWERDEKLYKLMLDGENHKKIEAHIQFNYELIPEYWDLRKDQLNDKYVMDKHMSEAKIKQYDTQIEDINKQIESDEKKIKELVGEDNA